MNQVVFTLLQSSEEGSLEPEAESREVRSYTDVRAETISSRRNVRCNVSHCIEDGRTEKNQRQPAAGHLEYPIVCMNRSSSQQLACYSYRM